MLHHQAAKAVEELPFEIQGMLLYSGRGPPTGWRRLYRRFSQPQH
jgi:hypothetical protein